MTVRDIVKLLSYGTRWKLVGARTGKKLCDSFNKDKTKEKYMDMPVVDNPIVADFYVSKNTFNDYVTPMISIWVSGQ